MASAIRTALCPRRIRPQGNILITIAVAATLFHVGMARTSIAGTDSATRPERSRRSFSRGVSSITVTGTTDARRRAGTTIRTEAAGRLDRHPPNVRWPERYRPRSSATASATTATSEAMVYGFGSHPSGA